MVNSEQYDCLQIHLKHHAYPIYIGSGCLADPGLLQQHVKSGQVCVVTNKTIGSFYLQPLLDAFSAYQCDVVYLNDGESHKNHAGLIEIYDTLLRHQHHRDTTLIALGGGMIGDMAGFAAATYHRGVSFLQIPTTLLAQVDASIGGKTGINYGGFKNTIGSFHQPDAVMIDMTTLSTLPKRELYAGLAEVIKYGLLAGGRVLQILTRHLKSIETLPLTVWSELIALCCQIKAEYVEMDERDQGKRALLNLGHTFAHALESVTDYQRWLHGEAVAIGLYCAALLSHKLGYLAKAELLWLDELLAMAQLPRRIPKNIDLSHLYRLMLSDKKIKQSRLRFILIKTPGACFIKDNVSEAALRCILRRAVSD